MPFASRAQQRYSYATGQPWRHEWAAATKKKKGGFARLPQRVAKSGPDHEEYPMESVSAFGVVHDYDPEDFDYLQELSKAGVGDLVSAGRNLARGVRGGAAGGMVPLNGGPASLGYGLGSRARAGGIAGRKLARGVRSGASGQMRLLDAPRAQSFGYGLGSGARAGYQAGRKLASGGRAPALLDGGSIAARVGSRARIRKMYDYDPDDFDYLDLSKAGFGDLLTGGRKLARGVRSGASGQVNLARGGAQSFGHGLGSRARAGGQAARTAAANPKVQAGAAGIAGAAGGALGHSVIGRTLRAGLEGAGVKVAQPNVLRRVGDWSAANPLKAAGIGAGGVGGAAMMSNRRNS